MTSSKNFTPISITHSYHLVSQILIIVFYQLTSSNRALLRKLELLASFQDYIGSNDLRPGSKALWGAGRGGGLLSEFLSVRTRNSKNCPRFWLANLKNQMCLKMRSRLEITGCGAFSSIIDVKVICVRRRGTCKPDWFVKFVDGFVAVIISLRERISGVQRHW